MHDCRGSLYSALLPAREFAYFTIEYIDEHQRFGNLVDSVLRLLPAQPVEPGEEQQIFSRGRRWIQR